MSKKKKIVFVMNNFWIGGTEKFLLGLIGELAHTRDIYIVTVLGGGPLESEFRKLPVLISHANPVNFSWSKPSSKLFWLLATPITLVRLLIFFHKVKPNAVVTSLYQSDMLGMLAARMASISKRVLIQHDIQKLGSLRKHFKSLFTINLATEIVAVSDAVKQFLNSYLGVPREKITVIPNGIDFAKFAEASKLFDKENIVFGIIGRLEPVKDHKCLLDAVDILKKKYQLKPKLIIAGGGSLEQELKAYAKSHGLTNVEFIGPILDPRGFFKMIDVAMFPSLEEGFGLVVLEGLAAGKLVIASDIGSFREIIHSGQNGWLFPAGDASALAEKVRNLIAEPSQIEFYQRKVKAWLAGEGQKFNLPMVAGKYRFILD